MLSVAILVLREVLEISLIIGMIATTFKNIKKRNIVLSVGIISGVAISILVAFAAKTINSLFEGNGQELFNIFILLLSILCIAWTITWFNSHGKKLKDKISALKNESTHKKWNEVIPIILIMSLSVAREGSELVLFLCGLSVGGVDDFGMLAGFILGAVLGVFVGLLAYFGLLKVKTKVFFRIINIFLILLAAGMSAQLANYLIAVDLINFGAHIIWDTSSILNENVSFIGKVFSDLLGYSSRPTMLEFLFYISTIMSMIALLKINKSKP